jgi:hypothetical protein
MNINRFCWHDPKSELRVLFAKRLFSDWRKIRSL